MRTQIATYCDSASEYGNRLCILGTIDTVVVDQFPYTRSHCCVALKLLWGKSEEGVHLIRVRFMDEDGKPTLNELESKIVVKVPPGQFFVSSCHVVTMSHLTFSRAGTYMTAVVVDNEVAAEIDFQVVQAG